MSVLSHFKIIYTFGGLWCIEKAPFNSQSIILEIKKVIEGKPYEKQIFHTTDSTCSLPCFTYNCIEV